MSQVMCCMTCHLPELTATSWLQVCLQNTLNRLPFPQASFPRLPSSPKSHRPYQCSTNLRLPDPRVNSSSSLNSNSQEQSSRVGYSPPPLSSWVSITSDALSSSFTEGQLLPQSPLLGLGFCLDPFVNAGEPWVQCEAPSLVLKHTLPGISSAHGRGCSRMLRTNSLPGAHLGTSPSPEHRHPLHPWSLLMSPPGLPTVIFKFIKAILSILKILTFSPGCSGVRPHLS